MATPVKVPPLGESVTSAILDPWLKNDGEAVAKDEPVCLLETDKANVDLPASAAGVSAADGQGRRHGQRRRSVGQIDTAGYRRAAAAQTQPLEAAAAQRRRRRRDDHWKT